MSDNPLPYPTLPAADAAPPPEDEAAELHEIRREVSFGAAERLTFFSDAVVAIAITLLALELPVPHGDTALGVLREMHRNLMAYFSFFISFAVIGAHWMSHHAVFRWLSQLGGRVMRYNLLWLMIIVLLPYLTKVLTEGEGNSAFIVRFGLYALAQVVCGVLMALMIREMWRHGLFRRGVATASIDRTQMSSIVMAGVFTLSIPFALFNQFAFLVWIAMPIPMHLLRRPVLRFLATHRPTSPPPDIDVM